MRDQWFWYPSQFLDKDWSHKSADRRSMTKRKCFSPARSSQPARETRSHLLVMSHPMKFVYICHPSGPPSGSRIPPLLNIHLSLYLTRKRVQISSEGGVGGVCCCEPGSQIAQQWNLEKRDESFIQPEDARVVSMSTLAAGHPSLPVPSFRFRLGGGL